MPRAYYQCPECRRVFTTRYKGLGRKHVPTCLCSNGSCDNVAMTYRGDGWDGRQNFPHGPPNFEGAEVKTDYVIIWPKGKPLPPGKYIIQIDKVDIAELTGDITYFGRCLGPDFHPQGETANGSADQQTEETPKS